MEEESDPIAHYRGFSRWLARRALPKVARTPGEPVPLAVNTYSGEKAFYSAGWASLGVADRAPSVPRPPWRPTRFVLQSSTGTP